MTPASPFDPVDRIAGWQRRSLWVFALGAILVIAAAFVDRQELIRSYLYAYVFWTGMALGCLGILLMHHTVGGKWGMVIRRFCEAGARTLPFMAILLIPVLVSMGSLYVWTQPQARQDANIQSKTAYLNVPFFIVRAVIYFAIWTFYARILSKWSREQDRTGDEILIGKMRAWSAPGLIVFTFSASFALFDWIMSLEPRWFSTIYGAMFLIGQVLEAFALVIMIVVVLGRVPPFSDYLTPQHYHDLGNMLFAFTILWAYLSFSQYLIIWAGNLPDEIPWYLNRLNHGWAAIGALLILLHFCLPFALMLQRPVKRRPNLLFKLCVFMLAMRIVDVYWIVAPAFYSRHIQVKWTDFAAMLAVGGLWLILFFRQLRSRPLLPLNDPRLRGAPREMVAF
jgi:hypothetical protein